MKIVLVLTVLGVVLTGASALKCYACVDCEKEQAEVKECGNTLLGGINLGTKPTCTKTILGEMVNKDCAVADTCLGRGEFEALGVKNYCCHDELCNSAGAPNSALALLLSPALLALIR